MLLPWMAYLILLTNSVIGSIMVINKNSDDDFLYYFFRKEMYMKKFLKVLSVCALSAAVAVCASVTASAAGINSAEQKILDELHTTVTMQGVEKSLPVSYINQTENYLNTVELTDEEADEIIKGIEETKNYLTSTGAANYKELTDAQVDQFFSLCQKTVDVIDLTIAYNKSKMEVSIVDKSDKVLFNTKLNSKTPGGSGGDIIDPNPIIDTGFGLNMSGVMTVAGVGILLVSAAGVYLIKTKKKVESENA